MDLTPWAADGQVQLLFETVTDGGLEMGGWTIDELCVVGYRRTGAPPGCGNGVLEQDEQCDDGNLVPGDGCNDRCEGEGAEDGGGDDDGNDDGPGDDDGGDGSSIDGDDGLVARGCACQAHDSGDLPGAVGLLALVMLGWRRRRA